MAIINGTFDTNLDGWTIYKASGTSVVWDSGRMKLTLSNCGGCSPGILCVKASQTFTIDQNILSFDWQARSDGWSEYAVWKLEIGGAVIANGGAASPPAGFNVSKHWIIGLSAYIGQTATLTFYMYPSPQCLASDHGNTYQWVDNVKLGTADIVIQDIKIGTIDCPSPGFVCNPNSLLCTNPGCTPHDKVNVIVTWKNNGNVGGTFTPMLNITKPSGIATIQHPEVITVPANSTDTTTFKSVTLERGQNNICADFGGAITWT